MVWGMALPGSFGDYFPGGGYVGWDEELAEYYNNKMPAERQRLFGAPPSWESYSYWVAMSLINEPGTRHGQDSPPFGPVAAYMAPKRFVTRKSYASLGSLIELTDMIVAVDELLKEVIERFEPGMHHFFPIEIVMPKKVVYPKQYFVMAIGQYIDSFSSDRSDSASWSYSSDRDYYFFEDRIKLMSGLALSRQSFGNAHLWRERRMCNKLTCFSDPLMSEIDRAGLRLPRRRQLKEVCEGGMDTIPQQIAQDLKP